jgi:hypothetical protein
MIAKTFELIRHNFLFTSSILALLVIGINASEICEFSLSNCPESYNNKSISVPNEVVAMSSKFHTCEIIKRIENLVDGTVPSSVVFIIDHSGSMIGLDTILDITKTAADINGERFRVTRDLLDTLNKINPNIDVGLVVFREVLYFDKTNNEHVVPFPYNGNSNQSYFPLKKLNQTLDNGQSGIQALQSLLATKKVTYIDSLAKPRIKHTYEDLIYKPIFQTTGNTEITLAFNAAKEALKSSANPRERQFIIYISDGENIGDTSYVFGKNVPTTFTIFLNPETSTPPKILVTMTNNIRNNGYSTSNPRSTIWNLKSSYAELMSLVSTNIIYPINKTTTYSPTLVIINNIISTNKVNAEFIFPGQFPLKKDTTVFTVKINYDVITEMSKKDTSITTKFIIKRQAVNAGDDIVLNCWEQGIISLYDNTTRIFEINPSMSNVEVRFDPGIRTYNLVDLNFVNRTTNPMDIESFSLSKRTDYWNYTMNVEKRETPVRYDNKFQFGDDNDSMIVIYKNPDIPLDSIRASFPIKNTSSVSFTSATYFDNNADGFIDSISITGTSDLTNTSVSKLQQMVKLPEFRNFSIISSNSNKNVLSITVRENRSGLPLTDIQNNETIEISGGILDGAGSINSAQISITDRVAPVIVSAKLLNGNANDSLQIEFSERLYALSDEKSFLFRKPGGASYPVTVNPDGLWSGKTVKVKITSIGNNFFIVNNDSIWIFTDASVKDIHNNIQNNQNNRRSLITANESVSSFIPHAVNNPFIPGQMINKYPKYIAELYKSKNTSLPSDGIILFAEPQNRINGSKELDKATITIYDVVKNIIIKDIPMLYDLNLSRFVYVWDGFNCNHKAVATGTYTAFIKVTKKDNRSITTKPLFIGVKRAKLQ